jgi:hypothetical protein
LPLGLLEHRDPDDEIPVELLEIISNPEHEKRIPAPPGPLLFYLESEDGPRSAVPMNFFLLNPDPRFRRAAFEHFDRLKDLVEPVLNPRTEAILPQVSSSIDAEEISSWVENAVRLFDAVSDDFLVALAGFRQSSELHYQEGINLYLRFLLRPTISSLEMLKIRVVTPSSQRDDFVSAVEQIARESNSLEDSLDRFLRTLGHLPFHPLCGVVKATERWRSSITPEEAWGRMVDWANAKHSPVPLAHIFLLALTDTSVLPKAEVPRLWQMFNDLMDFPREENGGSPWEWAWKVRCDLARHYVSFLECQCPGTESERIANLAWWMAERVASLFGVNPQTLKNAHEKVIIPELEASSHAWELAKPPLLPSLLQYATLDIPSVWSTSLLCQSGAFPATLLDREIASQAYEVLKEPLNHALLRSFPPPAADLRPPLYAFDEGLLTTAEAWFGIGDESKAFEPILRMYRGSVHEAGIRERLDSLKTYPEDTHVFIVDSLKILAWARRLPEELVRSYVSDEEWFIPVVKRLHPLAVSYFADILIQLHNQVTDRWSIDVPHFFASALLSGSSDTERRRLLFAVTIICCIATETTSALSRILSSEHRSDFEDDISTWIKRIESPMNYGLPWFQSRLRPALVVLERWKGNEPAQVVEPSEDAIVEAEA